MTLHKVFSIPVCAALLIVATVGVFAADGTEKKDPFRMTKRMIVEELQPQFKIQNMTEQTIIEPTLVEKPTAALRVILIGYPLKNLPGDKRAAKEREKPEYADLLLIPVDSTFRADKALRFSQPTTRQGTADFFFSQYGFEWRRMNSPFKHFTVYAGANRECHVFASTDIVLLLKMKSALMLRNGFSSAEYLAEALSVRDIENVTAETASNLLPGYGNEALPYLRREILSAVELEDSAYPHFRVLARIATPEACTMANEFVQDTRQNRYILIPLFDAVTTGKWINPRLMPVYNAMLERQLSIPFLTEAFIAMKRTGDLRPKLIEITENPITYETFSQAKIALLQIVTGKNETVHADAEKNIRLLLIRNGEVPDSVFYKNVDENAATREDRLSKEDEERIAPYVKKLMDAPERDLTMLVGLNLAMSDIQARHVSKQYVNRLRLTGIRILKAMPDRRNELHHVVRTLILHTKDKSESDRLQYIADMMKL